MNMTAENQEQPASDRKISASRLCGRQSGAAVAMNPEEKASFMWAKCIPSAPLVIQAPDPAPWPVSRSVFATSKPNARVYPADTIIVYPAPAPRTDMVVRLLESPMAIVYHGMTPPLALSLTQNEDSSLPACRPRFLAYWLARTLPSMPHPLCFESVVAKPPTHSWNMQMFDLLHKAVLTLPPLDVQDACVKTLDGLLGNMESLRALHVRAAETMALLGPALLRKVLDDASNKADALASATPAMDWVEPPPTQPSPIISSPPSEPSAPAIRTPSPRG